MTRAIAMDRRAEAWAARRTWRADDFELADLLARKGDSRVSVVVPARNEAKTVGRVVGKIHADLVTCGLVDEVVVMDSLSTDETASVAAAAGARVVSVADVLPTLGVRPGKGEALWKGQFVTSGDVLVFIDADLTDWDTHFVTGLLGPLIDEPGVLLVKGFYERILDQSAHGRLEGGRVTELVARPWLAAYRPELSAVVQPLAGEWAIRRSLFETQSVPMGYGVEIATLLDSVARHGLDALAQVDLGTRAHRHQHLHDLGMMAAELLVVMDRRRGLAGPDEVRLPRVRDGAWGVSLVSTAERPPGTSVTQGTPPGRSDDVLAWGGSDLDDLHGRP